MADSSIEWTDAVWNCVVGCSLVSAGCQNCYAARVAHRGMSPQHRGLTRVSSQGPQWTGEVRFVPEKLASPLSWKKGRRVFVNSMSDLFHDRLSNEQIAAVFGVMTACPQHTFQVLTKRPARMHAWFAWLSSWAKDVEGGDGEARICMAQAHQHGADWKRHIPYPTWPLPNVWLGVSAENQATANERVPLLLRTPAAVRFVSAEPLLGPVDFTRIRFSAGGYEDVLGDGEWVGQSDAPPGIDWVIVGGESGQRARPCDVAWLRSIVEQCRDARVACFVKQLGARPEGWNPGKGEGWELDRKGGHPDEWPDDLNVREFPEAPHG